MTGAGSDGSRRGRKASEEVAEQVRALVATRAVQPGDALPSETVLMERYGVARPTMREALRILESEGLITVQRGVHGGARVAELDVDVLARKVGLYLQAGGTDFDDLYEAQGVIEPGAVGLAALRRSNEDVAAMRACAERVARCEEPTEFAQTAAEFHLLLLRASGNQTLALVARVIESLVREQYEQALAAVTGDLPALAGWSSRWYTQVIDLIEAGDSVGAADFWAQHRRRVRDQVKEHLRHPGSRWWLTVFESPE